MTKWIADRILSCENDEARHAARAAPPAATPTAHTAPLARPRPDRLRPSLPRTGLPDLLAAGQRTTTEMISAVAQESDAPDRATSPNKRSGILAITIGQRLGAALFGERRLVRSLALVSTGPRRCCCLCRNWGCDHEPGAAQALVAGLLDGLDDAEIDLGKVRYAVIERPPWWSRGTPPLLAQVGGIVAGALLGRGVDALLVTAVSWKGAGQWARGDNLRYKILALLDESERTSLPTEHTGHPDPDAVFAVGVGLWALGRLPTHVGPSEGETMAGARPNPGQSLTS